MEKPIFKFKKYANSFQVYVENLEELSVEQIQEIESFVTDRKGIFDFQTYSFIIQKRLDFQEFLSLIMHSQIDAFCLEEIAITKASEPRIGFGQYKGMYYSELPDSYIVWLRSNYRGYERDIIEKELLKRKL